MAYAAVVSAKQKIEYLMQHPIYSKIFLPSSDMEFLYGELCKLEPVVERTTYYSQSNKLRAHGSERQVEDVMMRFEDLVESLISDRFPLSESEGNEDQSSYDRQLMEVKQDIISFAQEMMNEEQYCREEDQQPASNDFAAVSSTIYGSDGRNEMVGLDDELGRIKSRLLGGRLERQTVSIVGMAGIGKTTIAKQLYQDQDVRDHFDSFLFEEVGPNFKLKEKSLMVLLRRMCSQVDEVLDEMTERELGRYMYKSLKGARYLIVLDDVWYAWVWEDLKRFLPNNRNGSRVILTTRLEEIANCDSTYGHVHKIRLLNDEESWRLLRERVFTSNEELCSFQLEKLGKKIAKKCQGLPLAVLVVGDHLREVAKTVENWKKVAEDEDLLLMIINNDSRISRSLSWSYKMLPQYLKVIFLYMGVFPQNYDVPFSKLIKLWVTEGFMGQERSECLEDMAEVGYMGQGRNKTLEDMAEECLNDLISTNVILVGERSSRGKIKTCRIHLVFQNLCISEAQDNKFFHVLKKYDNNFPPGTNLHQRLCIHNNVLLGIKQVHDSMESVSAARSLLCFGPQHRHPLRVYLDFRSLRILDALTIHFYEFPYQVLKRVHLRYLAITYDGELPKSISRLWNLQVLIVRRHQSIKSSDTPAYLPMEIWNLHWLRHLHCKGIDLLDPSTIGNLSLILEKLLTLSGVSARSCTKGVLARIPNLMKLGVVVELAQETVETFSFFVEVAQQLRFLNSFKCIVTNPGFGSQPVSCIPAFSVNLRKITLSGCRFCWKKDMKAIGSLLNLQVLKLRCYAFCGPVWEIGWKEFQRLEFLLLEDLDIESWKVEPFIYRMLRHLIIKHCYKLKEFPLEVANIRRLDMIEVVDCSPSLAKKVQEVRGGWGKVSVHYSWDDHKKLKSRS